MQVNAYAQVGTHRDDRGAPRLDGRRAGTRQGAGARRAPAQSGRAAVFAGDGHRVEPGRPVHVEVSLDSEFVVGRVVVGSSQTRQRCVDARSAYAARGGAADRPFGDGGVDDPPRAE